jgi:hypothetical protein
MGDVQEGIANFGPPRIDVGQISQAYDLGQAVRQHIAANRLQTQLNQVAQEANSGTVTGTDGNKYDVKTQAGQQALRGRVLQAYQSVTGLDAGSMLGTGDDTMLHTLGIQQGQTASDAQQGAALQMANVKTPQQAVGAYASQANAAGLAGNFDTARAANEQGAITQGIQNDNPLANSSDPTARTLGAQTAAGQAVASAGANVGDVPALTSGTMSYLQSTSVAAAHMAGTALQQIDTNPMAAASSISALARLYPGLLPQGADPNHPYQYDPQSQSFVVVKAGTTNQPLVGADGQAMSIPAQAAKQWLPFAANNPTQIPQMLQGLYMQHAKAAQDLMTSSIGKAQDTYGKADTLSGMGLLSRAIMESDPGAMATVRGSLAKAGLKLTGPWAPLGGQAGASGNTSTSGFQAAVQFADGSAGTMRFVPGGNVQGAQTQPTVQFFKAGSSTPLTTVPMAAKGAPGTSITDVIKGLVSYKEGEAAKMAKAQLQLGQQGALDLYSQQMPGMGAPVSSAPTGGTATPTTLSPADHAMLGTLVKGVTTAPPAPLLAAIPQLEDSGPNATSPAGAHGQWQVTEDTAQPYVDELIKAGQLPKGTTARQALSDPNVNRVIGTAVATKLYDGFSGTYAPVNATAATLAAYNMGPSAAQAWAAGKPYKTQSGAEFKPSRPFDMTALPAETQSYLLRAMPLLQHMTASSTVPPAAAPAAAPAPAAPAAPPMAALNFTPATASASK